MSLPLSFFPSVEAAQLRAFLSSPLSFFLSFSSFEEVEEQQQAAFYLQHGADFREMNIMLS